MGELYVGLGAKERNVDESSVETQNKFCYHLSAVGDTARWLRLGEIMSLALGFSVIHLVFASDSKTFISCHIVLLYVYKESLCYVAESNAENMCLHRLVSVFVIRSYQQSSLFDRLIVLFLMSL